MVSRSFVALALILISGSCLAHSELPAADWCADGRIVMVGEFVLFPGVLPPGADVCPPDESGDRDCGQFDDDYRRAGHLAGLGCGTHALAQPGPGDIGSVIFMAEQPASFLIEQHHDAYRLDQGLSGVCLRCEQRVGVRPVRAAGE